MKFLVLKKWNVVLIVILILTLLTCSIIQISGVSLQESPAPIYAYTIVLDAGHGGIDPGGVGIKTKVKESEINLKITKKLKHYLQSFGVNVVLTRTDMNGLYGTSTKGYKKRDMLARKNIILENEADMVISVHINRYSRSIFRGAQVFYDISSDTSKALAIYIQNQFASNIPHSDKGISFGDFYMLKCTTAPSVLCECGYLSNEEDEALLIQDEHQDKLAYNIFCGIVDYLTQNNILESIN